MPVKVITRVDIKRFDNPDETRLFDRGRAEICHVGGAILGKYTFEPGWKWSESVKPIAKTERCEVAHTNYVISGRMHIVMADGSEYDVQAGDTFYLPPGHDGWVVGDEPAVLLDFAGAEHYADHGS